LEPTRTLEQQAQDAGKRLLDAGEFQKLETAAQAGAAAMKQLHEQRFETAFDKALNHAEGAKVTPGEKDDLLELYKLDADRVIGMIEAREPLVHRQPSGDPVLDLDQVTDPGEL